MATLKYPADLDTNNNDFVQFVHYPYRVNDAIDGTTGHLGGEEGKNNTPPRQGGRIIQMYMPNTTPGVQQAQRWSDQTFTGAKGQLIKQFLDQIGHQGMSPGAGNQSAGDIGEASKQIVLEMAAGFVGQDAATALQLGQGKVYNPNVEMLYSAPLLRKFTFDFNFIPKDGADTDAADAIIQEFKIWSAPGIEGNKFLEVPDIWKVTYFQSGSGGVRKHFRMNPFKPAVIEGVVTQDNPMSDLHTTISDPKGDVPVHTKMTLSFCETDITTRADHERAKAQGYLRGA